MDRPVEAEHLLHRAGRQRRVGDEAVPLVALAQHGDGAVADEVHGGLVAGDEQQHHGGAQLLLGELVALLLGREQRREEVVARVGPALLEDAVEVVDELT